MSVGHSISDSNVRLDVINALRESDLTFTDLCEKFPYATDIEIYQCIRELSRKRQKQNRFIVTYAKANLIWYRLCER